MITQKPCEACVLLCLPQHPMINLLSECEFIKLEWFLRFLKETKIETENGNAKTFALIMHSFFVIYEDVKTVSFSSMKHLKRMTEINSGNKKKLINLLMTSE